MTRNLMKSAAVLGMLAGAATLSSTSSAQAEDLTSREFSERLQQAADAFFERAAAANVDAPDRPIDE